MATPPPDDPLKADAPVLGKGGVCRGPKGLESGGGAIAYVGLGSNLGDRLHFLERAIEHLRALPKTCLIEISKWHETQPLGGPPQEFYLNGVAELETELYPLALFQDLQQIETVLGRPPRHERWGPRVIDLDLLSYGDLLLDTSELVLPHPRIEERPFVLIPLSEIAPDWRHPRLGKTAVELLSELAHADRSTAG